MKWSDLRNDLTSLSQEEKSELALMATITKVRKQRSLTQEQLASKANVTQAQVARVENLSYAPLLNTLTKILSGLDLELALVDRKTGKLVKI